MTALKKILFLEMIISLMFYSVVAWHWVTPRAWGWLDEKQLNDVMFAGTIWFIFMMFDCWKHRKEQV